MHEKVSGPRKGANVVEWLDHIILGWKKKGGEVKLAPNKKSETAWRFRSMKCFVCEFENARIE